MTSRIPTRMHRLNGLLPSSSFSFCTSSPCLPIPLSILSPSSSMPFLLGWHRETVRPFASKDYKPTAAQEDIDVVVADTDHIAWASTQAQVATACTSVEVASRLAAVAYTSFTTEAFLQAVACKVVEGDTSLVITSSLVGLFIACKVSPYRFAPSAFAVASFGVGQVVTSSFLP